MEETSIKQKFSEFLKSHHPDVKSMYGIIKLAFVLYIILFVMSYFCNKVFGTKTAKEEELKQMFEASKAEIRKKKQIEAQELLKKYY